MRTRAMLYPVMLLFLVACAGPSTFYTRLYDIESTWILKVEWYTPETGCGRGTMRTTAQDGEIFSGEWVSISNVSAVESRGGGVVGGTATVRDGSGTGTANAWGWASNFGFSLNNPGLQYGSFIMHGSKGTVINGVYQLNALIPNSGLLGAAIDNKGRRYKVMG